MEMLRSTTRWYIKLKPHKIHCELLWYLQRSTGLHKGRWISWLYERLLAAQGGQCFVGRANWVVLYQVLDLVKESYKNVILPLSCLFQKFSAVYDFEKHCDSLPVEIFCGSNALWTHTHHARTRARTHTHTHAHSFIHSFIHSLRGPLCDRSTPTSTTSSPWECDLQLRLSNSSIRYLLKVIQ